MVERTVKVRVTGDISDFNRKMLEAGAGAKAFTRELDTSTDRVANLTQTILALGPALVPISAAAVPAMAGLANQLGVGAAAAGVAVLAFHGLGKALDAVNQYSIDPTDANLKKMNATLDTIGPAGEDFVKFLQRARPEVQKLQSIAQAGLFPGVEAGLTSLSGLLPDVQRIIATISSTLGELATEAGANLDSPKWHEFIAFLDSEARPTLLAMGRTAGNFAEGLANLWMAFAPLENNFSQGFLGLARDFAKWTDGLDKTKNFQEFVAYVNQVGPEAWKTLGSLANAILQIVEAAAPVGEASLPIIKAFADAISTLADSNLGPLVIGIAAAVSAYSRLVAVARVANTGALGNLFGKSSLGGAASAARDLPAATRAYFDYGNALGKAGEGAGKFSSTSARLSASLKGSAKLAIGAGGLAFAMSGLADNFGLANTASLALAGSLLGPWGAAIGGGIGLVKDFAAAGDDAAEKIKSLTAQVNAAGPLSQHDLFNIQETGNSLVTDDKSSRALDDLNVALDNNKQKAADAKFAEAGMAEAMAGASQETRKETEALLDNIATKNQAADATGNLFATETDWRRALKEAQKQAASNNAGLDGNSEAVLKNRDAVSQLAGIYNRLADSGKASSKELLNSRADLIKVAEGMTKTHEEAVALVDSLLHFPKEVNPKVDLDDKATPKVSALQDRINRLHGKTVVVNTRYTYTNAGNRARDAASVRTGRGNADGGYISGPGGPRDDLIPSWLSNGEFVVNAAATKAHLGLLHTINSHKFADGGPVLQSMAPSGYLGPANYGWGGGGTTADIAAAVREGVRQGQREAFDGVSFEMSSDNRYLKTKVRRG